MTSWKKSKPTPTRETLTKVIRVANLHQACEFATRIEPLITQAGQQEHTLITLNNRDIMIILHSAQEGLATDEHEQLAIKIDQAIDPDALWLPKL